MSKELKLPWIPDNFDDQIKMLANLTGTGMNIVFRYFPTGFIKGEVRSSRWMCTSSDTIEIIDRGICISIHGRGISPQAAIQDLWNEIQKLEASNRYLRYTTGQGHKHFVWRGQWIELDGGAWKSG